MLEGTTRDMNAPTPPIAEQVSSAGSCSPTIRNRSFQHFPQQQQPNDDFYRPRSATATATATAGMVGGVMSPAPRHPAFGPRVESSNSSCHSFGIGSQNRGQLQAAHSKPYSRTRSLMNSFFSPFLSCVKPDIAHSPLTTPSGTEDGDDWTMPGNQPYTRTPHLGDYRHVSQPAFVSPAPVAHASQVSPQAPIGLHGGHQFGDPFLITTLSSSDTSASSSSSSVSMPQVNIIWQPNENDVLCGRKGGSNNPHLGNVRFRELVASQRTYYRSLTKKMKLKLARTLVDLIHAVGGRFLARDSHSGGLYDIGLPRSIEKTSQALREKEEDKTHRTGSLLSRSRSYDGVDDADSSCCSSEATVKVTNYQRNHTPQLPILSLPSHLQEMYGPALKQLTALRAPKMPQQQQSFRRPAPHPMPSHDHNYRYQQLYQRPMSTPPAQLQTLPAQTPAAHVLLRPASSLLPRPASPESVVSFGPESIPVDRPLGTAYPMPSSPQRRSSPHPLQQKEENIPNPKVERTGNMQVPDMLSSSPPFQQVWKRPRTQPEIGTIKSDENSPGLARSSSSLSFSIDGHLIVESKLSLNERVVRSPGTRTRLVPPSRVAGRHGRPATDETDHDCLAAMSTTAFLRLDEVGAN